MFGARLYYASGEVVGDGSLIIGPTAEVISNLSGLDEVGRAMYSFKGNRCRQSGFDIFPASRSGRLFVDRALELLLLLWPSTNASPTLKYCVQQAPASSTSSGR